MKGATALFGVLLFGCAAMPPAQASTAIVTGTYRYIDGDRLIARCGSKECIYTLIRDEQLAREAWKLVGAILTLEVKTVKACGPESGKFECYRSRDGTALRIVRWLKVVPRKSS